MAGDRRATAGYTIASRRIEKVFAADDFSGVAIAGAAGPAVEMVRLFQIQLEHYEKVEGETLLARGQGQPARPDGARATCPPPCRASWWCRSSPGYDQRRATGPGVQLRRHRRQVRGSRLPGQRLRRRARPQLDQGRLARGHAPRRDRSTLAIRSLFAAADEDTATGGPDLVRRHLPDGRRDRRRRVPRARRRRRRRTQPRRCSAAAKEGAGVVSMPFYVSPEQMMKDRADYARKGIARGRSLVALECAPASCIVAENAFAHALQDQRDLRPHRVRGRRQVQRVPDAARRRRAPRRPQGLLVLAREDVNARELANAYAQTLGQVFTHEMKPYEVEILVAAGRRDRRRPRRDVPHPLRRHRHGRAGLHVLGGQAEQITEALDDRSTNRHGARRRDQARRDGARRSRRRVAHRRSARGRAARPRRGPGARSAASRTTSSTRSSPADAAVASATSGA